LRARYRAGPPDTTQQCPHKYLTLDSKE
jgi:hypothetical protein